MSCEHYMSRVLEIVELVIVFDERADVVCCTACVDLNTRPHQRHA